MPDYVRVNALSKIRSVVLTLLGFEETERERTAIFLVLYRSCDSLGFEATKRKTGK